MTNEQKGAIYIGVAAFTFGLGSSILKTFWGAFPNIIIGDIVQIRMFLTVIVLALICLIKDPACFKIDRKDIGLFTIIGVCGIFVTQIFLMYSVQKINVGLATFTQASSTLMLCGYSIIILKEKLSNYKVIGLLAGFVGIFIIMWSPEMFNFSNILNVGMLASVASAVGKTIYILLGKKAQIKYDGKTVIMYSMITGAIAALFVSKPWLVFYNYGKNIYLYIFFLIFVLLCTVLPFLFVLKGLKSVQPSTVGILNIIEPLGATLSAFILVGEVLTLKQLIGCAFIVLGIFAIQIELKKKASD